MIVTVIIEAYPGAPAEAYSIEAEEVKMFLPTLLKSKESQVQMTCSGVGRMSLDVDVIHLGRNFDLR